MQTFVQSVPDYVRAHQNIYPTLEHLHAHINRFVPLEILHLLVVMITRRKSAVYQPGDDSREIYYLLDGRVTIYTSSVGNKKKRNKLNPSGSSRSITFVKTYFGEHEVAQEKRRVHTVLVDSDIAHILVIPSKYYPQLKLLRKEESNVFEGLQISMTYELIPKLMRKQTFVKGQEFNDRLFPVGVILSGQFQLRREIDLYKEDTEERVYEFRKMFPLLSFGAKQTLLWNCHCTSAFAEVMVMDTANYTQICEFDKQLKINVEETVHIFEMAVKQRTMEIRKTFDYKNVENSLGLSVKFKTESEEDRLKRELSLRPKLSERERMLKLREDIITRAQQPKFPVSLSNVLFKLPINRQRISEVRRKIDQLEVLNTSECPEYEILNKQFNRLFTPSFKNKFDMKMLRNTRSTGKTAGFAFFNDREHSCKKRRSLVLIS